MSRSNFVRDHGVLGTRGALSLPHEECIEEFETKLRRSVMRNAFHAATLFACAFLQVAMIAGILLR